MKQKYNSKIFKIILILSIILSFVCFISLRQENTKTNLLILHCCLIGFVLTSTFILIVIRKLKAWNKKISINPYTFSFFIIALIWITIWIIGNISYINMNKNIIKNGIAIEATINDVIPNHIYGYKYAKSKRKSIISTRYDIYIEYNINDKLYTSKFEYFNKKHEIGDTILIHCDINDPKNIITTNKMQNIMQNKIPLIFLLVLCDIIIIVLINLFKIKKNNDEENTIDKINI